MEHDGFHRNWQGHCGHDALWEWNSANREASKKVALKPAAAAGDVEQRLAGDVGKVKAEMEAASL